MSKGRLSRKETATRTRRELLDAAATVFAGNGYAGASVQQIAEAAGKTTGALYAHFATKQELFLALLRERLTSKIEALTEIGRVADTSARRAALGDRFGHLNEIEGDWDLLASEFWLYAVRNPKAKGALAAFYAETRSGIARLLSAELRRRRRDPTIPAEHLAALVIAIGDGLGRARRIEGDRVPASLFADGVEIVLREFSRPPRKVRKLPR